MLILLLDCANGRFINTCLRVLQLNKVPETKVTDYNWSVTCTLLQN